MPSLRIASIGASIASARTSCTPCGSCSGRAASAGRRPGRSGRRPRRRRGPRRRARRGRVSSRSRSSENSVQPSQSEAMKTVSMLRGALAAGRRGRSRRAAPGRARRRRPASTASRAGSKAGSERSSASRSRTKRAVSGHVAVEGGLVGPVLLGDVEGDLVAAGDQGAEAGRGLGGQPLQRLVEEEDHARPPLPPRAWRSCACTTPCRNVTGRCGLDGGGDSARRRSSSQRRAVAAHVLDQRHQRLALLGQRVLDPRRNLGEGVARDDALLFQRPQAQRERARADPLQRALQLAEAAASPRRGRG